MSGPYHLETDASLNLAKSRRDDSSGTSWFAGGGIVVRSPEMKPLGWKAVPLGYVESAEHAEGLALLAGMRLARTKWGATELRARSDNFVLVQHVNRAYKISESSIRNTVTDIWAEAENFVQFRLLWTASSHLLTRSDGAPTADTLARSAAGLDPRNLGGVVRRRLRSG